MMKTNWLAEALNLHPADDGRHVRPVVSSNPEHVLLAGQFRAEVATMRAGGNSDGLHGLTYAGRAGPPPYWG